MSGVVVDQTGLPLPGVQIEVRHADAVESSTLSGSDGTFAFTKPTDADDVVIATLDGFEPARVPIAKAGRITLETAHSAVAAAAAIGRARVGRLASHRWHASARILAVG